MGSRGKCRECGSPLPADGPAGLCAKCLLLLGVAQAGSDYATDEDPQLSQPQPGDALKPPPGATSASAVPAAAIPSEKPGDEIRGYKLLEQIGQGGFGVVYLAEQKEPVKRRVALKIIKLGMDTRQVVARFEAERQALALMDHPNIAKILEAGATETGRPYFVMELVGGIKITDYCEQNHLTMRERLDLFIQVCRAVQHAHQKGVIHRDIKPSNVLVATQDGVPVPKVIDFGIAKATQGKLTDQTVFTAFEQFLGTPAYMSPEQTQPGGLDVDTRSDIYSLGVLLYELLTGKTPFDTKELLAAGLEAMRRAIQEKEPPTPSTRLAQERHANGSAASGKPEIVNRKSEIDRDLDWIVMKCLEKDRGRRYETANGLAMDLLRHLSNEPVVAGPPGTAYRLSKFVRRNKTVVVAAAATTAVLVLGIVASSWEAHQQSLLRQQAQAAQTREEGERKKAQMEAAKSQQIARFLEEMLQGVGPSVAKGRDTTILKEILDKTAERVGQELTNQPEVEIDLRDTLGRTYMELGLYRQAAVMQRENLRRARAHFGEESVATARALVELGMIELQLGNYSEAETLLRQALPIRRKLFGNEHEEVGNCLHSLALVLHRQRKLAEAEVIYREALEMERRLVGNENRNVAIALSDLGAILYSEGKLTEAEALIREALAIRRKLFGNEHLEVLNSLNSLAILLDAEGKSADAEAMFRELLTVRKKLLGNEHPDVASVLGSLATALYRQGKLADAESFISEALTMERKLLGNQHPAVGRSLNVLGKILEAQGRLAEAEAVVREELTIKQKEVGKENPYLATTLQNLAQLLRDQGRLAEAVQVQRETLAILRKLPADANSRDLSYLGVTLHHFSDLLRQRKELEEAHGLAEEAVALYQRHPELALGERQHAVTILADVLKDMGDLPGVERLYREQSQDLRARLPGDDPALASMAAQLTDTLLLEGKFTEAEALARECLAIREKKLPDDWRTFNTRSLLGASLLGQQKNSEAELLLLSGYEGMKQREGQISAEGKENLYQALQRLVKLYETTGQTNQAIQWNKSLQEFERTQTNRPAVNQKP